MHSIVNRLVGPFRDPDDAREEVIRKMMLVPTSMGVVLTASLILLSAIFVGAFFGVAFISTIVLVNLVFLVHVYTTRRLSATLAGVYSIFIGGNIVLCDIWTYGLVDYYTTGVIMMDVLLQCEVGDRFTAVAMAITLLVIVVQTLEQTIGMGLYDSIPEEWSGYTRPDKQGSDYLVNLMIVRLFVFCFDFLMTRYFSYGMRAEKARMERSIVMAQEIAGSLARFDLDEGEEKVRDAVDLPDELMEAFTTLLNNLRTYKPYLPQSCLPNTIAVASDPCSDLESVRSMQHVLSSAGSEASKCSATDRVAFPLQRKSVSLMVVNIRGFLQLPPPLEAAGVHELYINCIFSTSQSYRGLVEGFSADRVLVSFNAVRPCPSHRLQSISCAEQISLHVQSSINSISLSTAVSSGDVLCGSLGCEQLRSYSLIGEVAAWVPVLERLGRRCGVGIITDSSITSTTAEAAHYRFMCEAVFTKQLRRGLFEFTGMRKVVVEEWMYQVASGSPWDKYNAIVLCLRRGDCAQALVEAAMVNETMINEEHHRRLLSRLPEAMPKGVPAVVVTDVGVSYGKPPTSTDLQDTLLYGV